MLAARLNGASGASDMDGNAARVAESESGEERINSSQNAAIHCVNSRRRPTGSNCSSMERSFRQISFQLSGKNGATGISDIHGNAARVAESEAGAERMNATNSSPFLLRF